VSFDRIRNLIAREQPLLLVVLRECEVDEDRPEEDRDDACGVRPVVPVQKRLFAPAMMALAYWGCCSATASAPSNDFVSCAWVASVTFWSEAAIWAATADAYPAVRSAPKIDCMTAPPRSR
jgi:hypothetical protein